ncbi:hypothetical protein D8674_002844 [Pyrus ussuriensis x Pyrus communis]|uniref:Uncharacterized protein n=1 Tax=Pyrus ussuriensis x Pyrus communis TaxID=2448454 RepID=A0A5N5FFE3_9ROSA|nr:hypothetical protein D8674_002844 [Pyrus ussuriensis x Pyrus communis]
MGTKPRTLNSSCSGCKLQRWNSPQHNGSLHPRKPVRNLDSRSVYQNASFFAALTTNNNLKLLFACVTVTVIVTGSFQFVFNQVDGTNGKKRRPSDPDQFTTPSKPSTAIPPSFQFCACETELDQRAHRLRGPLGATTGHMTRHHCRNSEAQTTMKTPRKFS